ncbi:MAG: DUF1501 domain-containing protein [Pirellulaceae bacterium]
MPRIDRRTLLQAAGLGLAGLGGWRKLLADELSRGGEPRYCILLWMTGGASQIDTFDMKPGHENGGEFKEIETASPGLRFSEHLPKLAKMSDRLAVIRSLSTKEGDHGRGTYLMRTGHPPMGAIRYPTIGSSLSKSLGTDEAPLPNYVAISPYRVFNQQAFGPGFLGPRHAALTVGAADVFQQAAANQNDDGYAELTVDDLQHGAGLKQLEDRLELWRSLQDGFLARHAGGAALAHDTVYRGAVRMMNSSAARAFDLTEETDKVRDAYGRGRFGQGCLMARRLIEEGVPFVEVSLGRFGGGALGWDTHQNNFPTVKSLSEQLDAGWGSLMAELDERGLLERTTILWMGEFGRTPQLRPNRQNGGRDHYPNAWSCVLAGGGIAGGQAYGKTSEDGVTVEENQVAVGDVLATFCRAAGVDPAAQNMSEVGRPIRIAEGTAIEAVLS